MKEGDHTANQHALYWTKVCEEFMQRLIAYAMRLANGRSYDADDLVQETVLHALNCSKDPTEVKKPVGYLLRIMRNIWITKWHDEHTANTESLDELQDLKATKNHPTEDPLVFRILENQEFAEAMRVILISLNPREKSLLKLYLQGYKCDEIAQIMIEDVRVTRSDLNAVRTKVQQRIKRKGHLPRTSSPQNYRRGT
jgi:RNA polymerase sigma factor (sigma-70 family)